MTNSCPRGTCILTILCLFAACGTSAQAGGTNACCMATGECVAGTTNETECLTTQGGTSFIADTSCDPNPCPQPGACCDAGGCQDVVESQCAGGFVANESCSSSPCCGDGTCADDEDPCSCPNDCDVPDSCAPCECGGQSSGGCWCDTACFLNGDCCFDVCDECACCGDATCDANAGEDHCNCPQDCADPNPFLCDPCECGDSSSDGTCYCDDICVISGDCCVNACDECDQCSVCGDATCSSDEDCVFCPEDCLACGDGFCDSLCEDNCSCPDDCSACGDGFCDTLCEDCNNCPADCVCGACCTGPDNCQVTLEADCSGEYQGDGTFCDTGTCAPPTGACCIDNQPCSEARANQCNAGTYQGDGTTCSPDPCQRQCCFEDGSCQNLPAADCASLSGTPGDAGSNCSSNSCAQPTGACVTAGGACTVTTQTECSNNSGTFLGAGTSCGACCMSDGTCSETTQIDCNGSYQGDGSTCTTTVCGACCLDRTPTIAGIGAGSICAGLAETECFNFGGVFQGAGTGCEPNPCPQPGACCVAPSSAVAVPGYEDLCITVLESECTGTFHGESVSCDTNPCPHACCFPNGSCQELSDGDCTAAGGTPQGSLVHCDLEPLLCPDPFGACCDPNTGCFEGPETACFGTYQGDGTTCTPDDPCPHACCFADGSCQVLVPADCTSQGGTPQGVRDCELEPILCPDPFGACCGAGSCFTAPAITCTGLGGTYQGDGTTCDAPGPCIRACCFPDGSCQELSGPDCVAQGGSPQGDLAHCDLEPALCPDPFGACCGAGDCFTAPELACTDLGGTWHGANSTCDPDPCAAPSGACCYEGKGTGCVEVTADECSNTYQGDFQGDNTVCTPDPCPAANECVNQPAGTACGADDNNACTSICTPEGACGIDCDDNNACTDDSCDPGAGCQHAAISCEDFDLCTLDTCDPHSGCVHEPICGACCLESLNGSVAGPVPSGCVDAQAVTCEKGFGGEFLGPGTSCETSTCNPERVDISTKGSLLIFSDVELEWQPGGPSPIAGAATFGLTTDTVISLTNDYPGEVYVQMYFINGDPELDPLFVGTPPTLVRDGEPGWNWVDCQLLLTPDQPIYWSAATGNPAGCQPFTILDPDLGSGPGRPNPDAADGSRVLRGFIVAWAVDEFGREINWNHLSGKATIVDYAAQTAWEYDAWALQALAPSLIDQGVFSPGILQLNGVEYEQLFDMLLFDFFAAGSQAMSGDSSIVTVDGELTLHVVSADLRQESDGPITTKAHFDIWNMNERKLSNTRRCLTCWDQALLSTFNPPNSFLLANLQSDKGKARINGLRADECDVNCFRDPMGNPLPVEDLLELLGDLFGEVDVVCSQDAALLGVATKVLTFSGPADQRAVAGSPLVGMGFEPAVIQYDIINPPGTLREEAFQRIGRSLPREHDRLETAGKKERN